MLRNVHIIKSYIRVVYAVHQGDDDRSLGKPKWYFSLDREARQFAKGRGWYGGYAPISKMTALFLPDEENVYILHQTEQIVLDSPEKQDKIDKLTPDQIKLVKQMVKDGSL